MYVRDFDFHLPAELIAQNPARDRGVSRLLCLDRASGALADSTIQDLPNLLVAGDLLVVNNSRVYPARLIGRRVPSGGAVECLLLRRLQGDLWQALVHPGQKLKPGARMAFHGAHGLQAEILERRFSGRRLIRLWTEDGGDVDEAIDAVGHIPLPPYIKRPDRAEDRDRYQTVFARSRGSIAAPTAGLHFTRELLAACTARGVRVAEITLHVGYGTFQPVRVERVEEHRVEPEWFEISPETALAISGAQDKGRRIIAVGTTTTRTLEAVGGQHGGRVVPGADWTDLFIYPGFTFRVVSGMLTNFHLPQSSLLMLVAAFAGRERVLAAYRHAIEQRYRFYSYGDAMLIL
ncbi:MAG TPA: tRNA preQ1(34) S-adenosylmethionine ribosyltransferase-isomerase QueA [Vicinamibacterales bacterium]|jgi:S-adenosylmethionine:tRNA ribosyltransferase-isomerase|nr:tRNA preQ1(34) S-adenosylmethionine ribosyltransferase-isomerase QueA [Vicinamibacterales bacterium]